MRSKWIWGIVGGILGVSALLFLWAWTAPLSPVNDLDFRPIPSRPSYDSLLSDTASLCLKGVPASHAAVFCIVCEGYPELRETAIELQFGSIPTTMQAQPRFKKGGRQYKIVINNDPDFEGIAYDDIPFNAQVGIVAHEMAHILDYELKSTRQLAGTGFRFILSKKQQAAYEKSIDALTVRKGFGYQLKDWAQYAMYDSKASPDYKEFKRKFYLRPKQIDSLLLHLNE